MSTYTLQETSSAHQTPTMPQPQMLTGNPVCDALLGIHLEGNIVPSIWFKTIVNSNLKNPKPNLLAINILADIVYWHRPTEIRNEQTGQVIQYKPKFARNLLQRNYKQLSNMFGCSEAQAKAAIVFLEKMGVIKRVFQDVTVAGTTYSNVMFIALNPNRLMELTYPSDKILVDGGQNFTEGGSEISPDACENIITSPTENIHNTNNTTNNTTAISEENPSIFPSRSKGETKTNMIKDINNKETIYKEFSQLTELDFRRKNGFRLDHDEREAFRFPVYNLIVDCLVEMCTSGPQTFQGVYTAPEEIKQYIQSIVERDRTLCFFAEEVMENYIDISETDKIKNVRQYLKTMLWDQLRTYLTRSELWESSAYESTFN